MTTNNKGVGNMVSENRRKSIDAYDSKTYSRLVIKMRKGDDDDVIQAMKDEVAAGGTNRATLRKWWEAYLELNK